MIKFKVNSKEINLEVETKFSNNVFSKIVDVIKTLHTDNIEVSTRHVKNESVTEVKVEGTNNIEKPIVRDRLPNGSDVSVGDYEAVSSKTTAHYNFMCSKCYQAMSIKIGANIVLKDIKSDKQELHMLNSSFTPNDNFDILKLSPTEIGSYVEEAGVTILSSEELNGTCINCGNFESTSNWVEAYKNKKSITGCDETCAVCGSEMLYVINENGESVLVCDNKHCGHSIEIKNT